MKRKKEQPKAVQPKRQPKRTPRKKTFFFTYSDKKYSLTEQQKLFCDLFLTRGISASEAIIGAGYDVSGYKNKDLGARAIASENQTKPNIKAYIRMNLSRLGLDDENVSKVHAELLDDANYAGRAKAVDMYYKMHGSYVADSAEAKVNEELADALARIRKVIPD